MSNNNHGLAPNVEGWLGQIWMHGKWMDYARGLEFESKKWQATDPTNRRIVHWTSGKVLVPPTIAHHTSDVLAQIVDGLWGEQSFHRSDGARVAIVDATTERDMLADVCDVSLDYLDAYLPPSWYVARTDTDGVTTYLSGHESLARQMYEALDDRTT